VDPAVEWEKSHGRPRPRDVEEWSEFTLSTAKVAFEADSKNLCAKYLLDEEVVAWMGRECSMGQLENLSNCAIGLGFEFEFKSRENGQSGEGGGGEWTALDEIKRMLVKQEIERQARKDDVAPTAAAMATGLDSGSTAAAVGAPAAARETIDGSAAVSADPAVAEVVVKFNDSLDIGLRHLEEEKTAASTLGGLDVGSMNGDGALTLMEHDPGGESMLSPTGVSTDDLEGVSVLTPGSAAVGGFAAARADAGTLMGASETADSVEGAAGAPADGEVEAEDSLTVVDGMFTDGMEDEYETDTSDEESEPEFDPMAEVRRMQREVAAQQRATDLLIRLLTRHKRKRELRQNSRNQWAARLVQRAFRRKEAYLRQVEWELLTNNAKVQNEADVLARVKPGRQEEVKSKIDGWRRNSLKLQGAFRRNRAKRDLEERKWAASALTAVAFAAAWYVERP
jgi:hypothetical protein